MTACDTGENRSLVIQKRYDRLIYRNAVTKLYNKKRNVRVI